MGGQLRAAAGREADELLGRGTVSFLTGDDSKMRPTSASAGSPFSKPATFSEFERTLNGRILSKPI